MTQSQGGTLTAVTEPLDGRRMRRWRAAASATTRRGNGRLRVLGLLTIGAIAGLAAWDLRRRGLPALADVDEYAPYLLLPLPLLAGLGMLAGRRPPTWAGLLLGSGTWSVLVAVWSVRWLVDATGGLVDGTRDLREFAGGLTWVPYLALVLLGLVVLATVLMLRGHRAQVPCRTRSHQLLTLGAAVAALLGPLWVLALVPAMGLGLRRPHRTAAVAWAGWVVQGVVGLALAADGQIPSSGLPALVLHPSATTAVLLSIPLLAVAGLAGALAALPAAACKVEETVAPYAPAVDWTTPNDAAEQH